MSSASSTVNHLLDRAPPLRNSYAILRHGQSLANVAGLIASNPDVACHQYGLSPSGQVQAELAGAEVVLYYQSNPSLKGLVILSSDLKRATETAETVKALVQATSTIPIHQNQVIVETRLRERWFGDWDGTSDENYHQVWKDDAVDASHTNHAVESVHSVMQRSTAALVDWDKQLSQHLILCVAHGDVLQILQTAFAKCDGREHRSLQHLETAKLRPLELAVSPK